MTTPGAQPFNAGLSRPALPPAYTPWAIYPICAMHMSYLQLGWSGAGQSRPAARHSEPLTTLAVQYWYRPQRRARLLHSSRAKRGNTDVPYTTFHCSRTLTYTDKGGGAGEGSFV